MESRHTAISILTHSLRGISGCLSSFPMHLDTGGMEPLSFCSLFSSSFPMTGIQRASHIPGPCISPGRNLPSAAILITVLSTFSVQAIESPNMMPDPAILPSPAMEHNSSASSNSSILAAVLNGQRAGSFLPSGTFPIRGEEGMGSFPSEGSHTVISPVFLLRTFILKPAALRELFNALRLSFAGPSLQR